MARDAPCRTAEWRGILPRCEVRRVHSPDRLGGKVLSRDTKLDREIPTPGLIVPIHRYVFTGRR